MSRQTKWRQTCPELVRDRITKATEERLYILRETGPTGFLIKGENNAKLFKVFLGNPHSCSCSDFHRAKELCIHILWILLRKFRVAAEDPIVYQLSLVEREVNNVIKGLHSAIPASVKTPTKKKDNDEKDSLPQKIPDKDDVCSICQDSLKIKSQALTFCKFGCGNTIHTKCMKVYSDHQKLNGETVIKCPLCRSDFGNYHEINQGFVKQLNQQKRKESIVHVGVKCRQCGLNPIKGECYRCCECPEFYVCGVCIEVIRHPNHPFQWKKKVNQQWQPAENRFEKSSQIVLECNVLPLLTGRCFNHTLHSTDAKKDQSSSHIIVRSPKKTNVQQRKGNNSNDLMVTGRDRRSISDQLPLNSGSHVRSAPTRKPLVLPPIGNTNRRSNSANISRSDNSNILSSSPLDYLLSINGSPSSACGISASTHKVPSKYCRKMPQYRKTVSKHTLTNESILAVSVVPLTPQDDPGSNFSDSTEL